MRLRIYLPIFLFTLAMFAELATAERDVRVLGLFKDRAVVLVEGKRRTLSVGQKSREGILLISADSESAVMEVDGERITARLDGRISSKPLRAPPQKEVQIWRDRAGMFTTVGSINGMPVSFLVDTGATQIAMNSAQARRLGIDFRVNGKPSAVKTASGIERAYEVVLDAVKVGDIQLHNIGAAVLDGPQPDQVLLGMSFLGQLKMVNDGRKLTLSKKF